MPMPDTAFVQLLLQHQAEVGAMVLCSFKFRRYKPLALTVKRPRGYLAERLH